MARERLRRYAPALVIFLVALLVGMSIGTSLLVVRHFKREALDASRLYGGVFAGLNDSREGAEASALAWHWYRRLCERPAFRQHCMLPLT